MRRHNTHATSLRYLGVGLAALAALAAFACAEARPPQAQAEIAAVKTETAAVKTVAAVSQPAPPAAAATAPTASDNSGPVAALNAMDPRTPVPLQPIMAWHQKQNMQQHLVAIQGILAALIKEDWTAVETAAADISTSPQMQQMCRHMGAGAKGFTKLALEFHHRADGIGAAAKAHDGAAVLRATAHTLQACTTCHATYKQDVVDAATWQRRTGSTHVPGGMEHGGMEHGSD